MLIKNIGCILVIVAVCLAPSMAFADLHKGGAHHLKTARHSTSQHKLTGATDLCEQDATSLYCSLKKLEESNYNLKKQLEAIVSLNNEKSHLSMN